MRRPSRALRNRLDATIRARRRRTLYRMLARRHGGTVPCFVCGRHVEPQDATLEHILPISKGGTDAMNNLSISHGECNRRRGNGDTAVCAKTQTGGSARSDEP